MRVYTQQSHTAAGRDAEPRPWLYKAPYLTVAWVKSERFVIRLSNPNCRLDVRIVAPTPAKLPTPLRMNLAHQAEMFHERQLQRQGCAPRVES